MTPTLFDGATFDEKRDGGRLQAQLETVRQLVIEQPTWWTLKWLSAATGYPEASVSARLRDLRKAKFGGYLVERKYISNGQWAYRVTR
jgi:hypothetical protein